MRKSLFGVEARWLAKASMRGTKPWYQTQAYWRLPSPRPTARPILFCLRFKTNAQDKDFTGRFSLTTADIGKCIEMLEKVHGQVYDYGYGSDYDTMPGPHRV